MKVHPIMDISIKCMKCNTLLNFTGKISPKVVMYGCPKCKMTIHVYYNKEDIGTEDTQEGGDTE